MLVPFPTPLTTRGMGTSLRRYDFWDRLDVQALLMTTACHTKTIPEITAPKSWPILSRDSKAGKDGKETYKLDCKTVFPLKIGLRAFSPQSRSPFSSSLQTFCLTNYSRALEYAKIRTVLQSTCKRDALTKLLVKQWCFYSLYAVMKRGETWNY